MRSMDLNVYKLFAMVAESGNISRVAEMTGYTQSGISHSMKRLEDDLNVRLLVRDRYGVHVTPIGMDILQRVRKVLNANEELEQLLYDVQGLEVGSLTIGAFSSIAVNWLPQIVGSFKHAHPNIAISLKEGGTAELHKWIQEQQVDFAFCNPLKNQTAEFIPLKTDEFVAIFPADYPLDPTLTAYPLENLTGQPFILSEPSYDYSTTDMLRENGVAPDILFSSRNDYAIMSMVEHHIGVSILPELMIEQRKPHLKYLPLLPRYYRKLGILFSAQKDLSLAAQTFIHFTLEYFHLPARNLRE